MTLFHGRRNIDQDITLTCTAKATGANFRGDDALAQALEALKEYEINGSVTIQLLDGVYGAGTPLDAIDLTHQNLSKITIRGNDDPAITFNIADAANAPNIGSSYIYIDNSAGVYHADDFAPGGDYRDFIVHVADSTGNDGAYQVTAAAETGTDMRLTVSAGSVKSAVKDGVLYFLPANYCQLVFGESNGLVHLSSGQVTIRGLFLSSDSTGNHRGLLAERSGCSFGVSSTIFSHWPFAVHVSRAASFNFIGAGYDDANVVLGSNFGIYGFMGGVAYVGNCVASDCTYGYAATDGGMVYAPSSIASRNTYGYRALNSGVVQLVNGRVYNNNTGCLSEENGTIRRAYVINVGNASDYNPGGTPPSQGSSGGWIV